MRLLTLFGNQGNTLNNICGFFRNSLKFFQYIVKNFFKTCK